MQPFAAPFGGRYARANIGWPRQCLAPSRRDDRGAMHGGNGMGDGLGRYAEPLAF